MIAIIKLIINIWALNKMGLFCIVVGFLKSYSIPVFKSFFRAYKDTTAGKQSTDGGSSSSGKKHPMD